MGRLAGVVLRCQYRAVCGGCSETQRAGEGGVGGSLVFQALSSKKKKAGENLGTCKAR